MPSSVLIRSPAQNNMRLAVMRQIISDDGDPVGEPEVAATLDDGEECTVTVSHNICIVVLEHARNAPAVMPVPEPAVIGAGDPHQPVPEPAHVAEHQDGGGPKPEQEVPVTSAVIEPRRARV